MEEEKDTVDTIQTQIPEKRAPPREAARAPVRGEETERHMSQAETNPTAPTTPERREHNGRYDLHIHSAISDGTQSLEELVTLIAQTGLAGFALTDHDTASGWDRASRLAEEHGLDFLPGAEFSCRYHYTEDRPRTKTIHLLAYGFDPVHSELAHRVEQIRLSREGRARAILERLAADYPLTWDDVLAHVGEGNAAVGRPHIADALVAAGIVRDRTEAFNRLLYTGSPYYVPQQALDPVEAVRLVREAGGVPVIAHPMSTMRGPALSLEYLGKLVDAGLAGVEVYHRENSAEDRSRLLKFIEECRAAGTDLLVTGSSDYHGAGKPNLLGENTTDAATVARIREQIA